MDYYDLTIMVHVHGTRYQARRIRDAIWEALENAAIDDRAPFSRALARLRDGFTLEISSIKKRRQEVSGEQA